MTDKIKAIVESIKKDPKLGKRLDEEFNKIEASSDNPDPVESEMKAVKTVLGVDITPADLMRMKAVNETVDPDELDMVTGRGAGNKSVCYNASICVGAHNSGPHDPDPCFAVFEDKKDSK